MKTNISAQYQYVKFGEYYFCLQQNPFILAWILFFRREDLLALKPWLKKNYPHWELSRFWDRFKSNLKIIIYFMSYKLNSRNVDFMELPVYGQVSVPIHKGYKIFNFYRGVVTKFFDPDVNAVSINSEIDHLKKISRIDFAPSLRRWNSGERWYEEDYVRGTVSSTHRSTDSDILLKAFYKEAVPCMKSLISFHHPVTKELQKYLKELKWVLDVSGFPEWNSYPREMDTFSNFVNFTFELLKSEENQPVNLVFTHGDFCPANILSTKNGIRIVDWENAGNRSLLFDFYTYFFYRPVIVKNFNVENMFSEINQSLPVFISSLDLKITLAENVYRRLFYVEHLYRLVERLQTDKRLNIMDFIIRYIDVFNLFEQKCNDGTCSGQIQSVISTTP